MTRVRHANGYIDRLSAERDMPALHQAIRTVGTEPQLPEEFRLFCRLVEWAGATRSARRDEFCRFGGRE